MHSDISSICSTLLTISFKFYAISFTNQREIKKNEKKYYSKYISFLFIQLCFPTASLFKGIERETDGTNLIMNVFSNWWRNNLITQRDMHLKTAIINILEKIATCQLENFLWIINDIKHNKTKNLNCISRNFLFLQKIIFSYD